uniref:Chaperone protein DnaJ 11, chloroplastic n=1 Tax=Tanacetum cinerariifolium TaxID=118510 RepID=A0A6L2N6J0_TANCI|nr:chaperone protein DnaJ 11, chloroplastic [Tanacetum cinerariifolium]
MKFRVPGQDGVEGNAAKRYRGDNNMAALGVAPVIEEYAHESLTFRDAVACKGGLSGNHDEEKKSGPQSEVPALVEAVMNWRRLTIITKDLSWTGLLEFADDTVTDYSRPSPTIESSPDDAQNKNPSTETRASDSTILSKPAIKFVKAADKAIKRLTTDKVKIAKKPAVKYAELYRKPSKKPTVRGNQRNWNNLKSQQLGTNFVMKKKVCYNCGGIDHLSYNCGLGVKMGRSSPKNNYTHRSMPPKPAIHRPYRTPMRTTRPNSNAVTRPYVNSARPQTTQELMIILIQGV